ncbi:hypothetical protein DUZ99_10575 [Xylanibacillus composti]|nr:hypothetical protein [Xylanibacillus composti]
MCFMLMSFLEVLTIVFLMLTFARISFLTYWRAVVAVALVQANINHFFWSIESLHGFMFLIQLAIFMIYQRHIFHMSWFASILVVGLSWFIILTPRDETQNPKSKLY